MIDTVHLFPVLDLQLIELLRSLEPGDWNKRTLAKQWNVKDIAAHLLDGNMRTLSFVRDGHSAPPDREIHSYRDLVDFLNQLNADWVTAYKRVSPQVLIQQLEITGKEYSRQIALLDPDADAIFSVAWAGEQTSKNWFHVAREYTEKWHHQQQIRDAVGIAGIMTKELFYPMIATFMRGLPHTYRDTMADRGTTVHMKINTEIGGDWFLVKKETGWELSTEAGPAADVSLVLEPDTAWKLFTKGVRPENITDQVSISGDEKLARVALELVAVMA